MTRQVVLAGGPEHARRLDTSEVSAYLHLETQSWRPAMLTQPPRPPWWRHPLAWRRWKPITARPVPGPVTCVYRFNGYLGDGTPVYWYGGPYTPPPEDPAEVLRHLYQAYNEADPWHRMSGRGHWEMGPDWYTAIRRAPTAPLLTADRGPDALFSAPVQITFGSPRYVTRDTP